jgi:hypothetical protein
MIIKQLKRNISHKNMNVWLKTHYFIANLHYSIKIAEILLSKNNLIALAEQKKK